MLNKPAIPFYSYEPPTALFDIAVFLFYLRMQNEKEESNMQKILKLTGVSMLAIVAATNANAAGYTCEELIEYTSCNPGYWLKPEGSQWCPNGYTYVEQACLAYNSNFWMTTLDENECVNESDGVWYGNGCLADEFIHNEGYNGPNDFYPDTPNTCIICPIGSICTGGTTAATPCPAGSYCATTGLSTPTGPCAQNTYSTGGATACSTCPDTGLTDINGNAVSATTASTGSTGPTACFVDPNAEFKDDSGVYHFKQNCMYSIPTFEQACAAYKESRKNVHCDYTEAVYYGDDCYEVIDCEDRTCGQSPYGTSGILEYDAKTGQIWCTITEPE